MPPSVRRTAGSHESPGFLLLKQLDVSPIHAVRLSTPRCRHVPAKTATLGWGHNCVFSYRDFREKFHAHDVITEEVPFGPGSPAAGDC